MLCVVCAVYMCVCVCVCTLDLSATTKKKVKKKRNRSFELVLLNHCSVLLLERVSLQISLSSQSPISSRAYSEGHNIAAMSNLANDPAALAHILSKLSANDTATIRQGEKELKQFLKTPACIAALLQQITQNPDESARHQAALLLKKKINGFYEKFDVKHRVDLKNHILQVMTSEPSKSVGTAIAGAVATLSKAVMTAEKDWPELFSKLMELAQSPNENMRVLNYSLLEQVC